MNIKATNEQITDLMQGDVVVQVAQLFTREFALNLECCHSYVAEMSRRNAKAFLETFTTYPLLACMNPYQGVVQAMLANDACDEFVDLVAEITNGFAIVSLLGYDLIFGLKSK